MSSARTRSYDDCLSASWLSTRLGVDVARIDAMRRGGELIAVRPEGGAEWLYPAWQFAAGRPRPVVARLVAAAGEAGLDERRLYQVLTTRIGLGPRSGPGARSGKRLSDLLVEGEDEQVVAAVRASAPG